MSQIQRKPMSGEEFLAWEQRQDVRWEFDGCRPVALTGGTDAHAAVHGNLITALNTRLRGRPCYVRRQTIKVAVGASYRYPDAFVSCTPVEARSTFAADPVVIFEILSDSTERADRTTKLVEYRTIPSVKRSVMLEQQQAIATVITRTETGWSIELLDADAVLAMPEIDVELPIAELYEGVELIPLEDDER